MSRYHPAVPVKTPRVPLKLSEAVRALAEVRSIDDAKFFADKADALAAWAKIYKDDEAGLEARRVKLHAYRRMGELAEEIQPTREKGPGEIGRPPGAPSLLQTYGFSRTVAGRIMQIARTPEKKFERAVRNGEGIHTAARMGRALGLQSHRATSESWHWLTQYIRLRALTGRSAKEVASAMSKGETTAARKLVSDVTDWLDEFEQYLP